MKAHEALSVECPIEAEPKPDVKWFKDGLQMRKQTSGELMFLQVTPEDAGQYHCEASNYLGATSTRSFLLHVKTSKYSYENDTRRSPNGIAL